MSEPTVMLPLKGRHWSKCWSSSQSLNGNIGDDATLRESHRVSTQSLNGKVGHPLFWSTLKDYPQIKNRTKNKKALRMVNILHKAENMAKTGASRLVST